MRTEQFTNNQRERGNAEIIFIALLTVSVIGIGAVGISMTTGVSSDTSEQMDSPDFERSDSTTLEINYSSGPVLNNKDETKAIKLYDGEQEHVVYDANSSYDLTPGEPLVRQDELRARGIKEDTTVEVIWERKNGESEVVDEIYIPNEDLMGTEYFDEDSNLGSFPVPLPGGNGDGGNGDGGNSDGGNGDGGNGDGGNGDGGNGDGGNSDGGNSDGGNSDGGNSDGGNGDGGNGDGGSENEAAIGDAEYINRG